MNCLKANQTQLLDGDAQALGLHLSVPTGFNDYSEWVGLLLPVFGCERGAVES